jgi:uncharacterized protein
MISDEDFRVRYGPWALVAGGSLGMGAEYSRQLARRGLNVVLVAEAPEPLQPLAAALASEHGVETRAIVLDLAAADPLPRRALVRIMSRATRSMYDRPA